MKVFAIFCVVFLLGVKGEDLCAKYEQIKLQDLSLEDTMGVYYAVAFLPFEEDVDAKCLYYNASLVGETVHFEKVLIKNNNERIHESGTCGFEFENNKMMMNFKEPTERTFDVHVLAMGDDYEIDINCRGSTVHPYAFSRSQNPSQETIEKIYKELEDRKFSRDSLTVIDHHEC